MPESTAQPLQGFAGGVNLASAPNQLAPDEAIAINNMILDERGAAAKRRGSVKVADLPGRAISMFTFYRPPNVPQVVVQTSDGQVRFTADEGATWTTIVSGISGTAPYSFKAYNNKLYMSNGVDPYASWNGSVYTTYPAAPKGKYLTVWKDVMWVSGLTTDRDIIWASDVTNPEVFGASRWVRINPGDGDEITALDTDENFLIVFKRRRIGVMYDPVSFANRWTDTEKGCESHFSVVHAGERIFFLSRLGVCEFIGDAPAREMSHKIDPVFSADVININLLHKAWAYAIGTRVGWSLIEAGRTTHSLQIELYPHVEKAPWTFHRVDGACFTVLRRATEEYLFFGKGSQNKLMLAGVGGTDDGEAFIGSVEPGWFDLGDPLSVKYLRQMWVIGRGRFYVQVKRDFELGYRRSVFLDYGAGRDRWGPDGIDTWGDGIGSDVWGPEALYGIKTFHPDVYGRYISLRFSDSEVDHGSRAVDVGDVDYILTTGQWAVYGGSIHAILMGANLR